MAEIKSAIELAMERTRNLVMDDEEKRASRIRETENRTRAILRRYLEGMVETDRAMEEFDEIAGDRRLKRETLVASLFEEIDITRDNSRSLALLGAIGGSPVSSVIRDFEKMEEQFSREMEKQETTVRKRVENRLKDMGISGTAVEPNVGEWDEWFAAREKTGLDFNGRIKEWKERFVKAAGSD
jgi:hypothetical protein